jgi:hypothetical protein
MISRFSKKITIYNIGLLIIVLRIYGFLINFLHEYSENIYIFPKVGENGYPFKESIQYNLEDINKITSFLLKKNQRILKPITLFTSNQCSFVGQINMCKGNNNCFNEMNVIKEGSFIYHENETENNNMEIKNSLILNLLQDQNKFKDKNNIEKELPFYYKMIDGYSSYLSILSNNIDSIKNISKSEEKINNLLFLYVLYLKAYTSNYKIANDFNINKILVNQEKNLKEAISSLDESNIEQLITIMNVNVKNEIINCIPDLDKRYSFLIDFKSLLAMIQAILKIKPNNYEYRIFDFLFMKLNKALNYLFFLEKQANRKIFIFSQIRKYIPFIYWTLCIICIYFANKYFIKKKEFYSENNIKNNKIIDKSKYKKLLKYQKNIETLQRVNKNKYTKEEVDMINKLTKGQNDYVVSS